MPGLPIVLAGSKGLSMTSTRIVLSVVACAALAGCASGGGRAPSKAVRTANEAALRSAGSIGDPGKVAAADIAFARAARDEGQWTAFAEFAATGAVLHGEGGVIEAAPWLSGRANPPAAVQWAPKAVFASCDGTLAVSTGRFVEPGGLVGSYVTVWQLERDGTYKWIYDMGAPDDPQPPAPLGPEVPPGEDVIVVEALDAIEGKVADCPQGTGTPSAPVAALADGARSGAAASRDGTLQYHWEHHPDGTRRVAVDYLRDGQWQMPVDFAAEPRGEEQK